MSHIEDYIRFTELLHCDVYPLMLKDLWGEHSDFPREDWRIEVAEQSTQLGYWNWVSHQLEAREIDPEIVNQPPVPEEPYL